MSDSIETPSACAGLTSSELRLAIIGFGRLAQEYYLPALSYLPPAFRISVADPLASSRDEAKKRLPSAPVYSDYQTLLAEESLDAVLVVSPPSTHFEIWRACAERQLPFFMEKPVLLPADLKRIDPEDPAWSSLLMVDFNRRFWPPYQRVREWVRSGRMGRPIAAQFTLDVNVLAWSTVTQHRLDEREGGALYDLGSQVLDLVGWVFDEEPVSITARFVSRRWTNDWIEVTLEFPSGLRVECDFGYGNRNRESVLIRGERGALWIDDPNFLPWCGSEPTPFGRAGRRFADFVALAYRGVFRDQSMLRYTIRASLERFLSLMISGREPSPGLADWIKVAGWLEAAAESATRGQPLPLGDQR
jgi:predicted dehydrogenase